MTYFRTKFHDYQTENVASKAKQGFPKIWASEHDWTWPIFKFVWDFFKTKMLIKIHDYQTENVASKGYTRFF